MKQLLIPILLFVTSFCVGQTTGIFPKATASGTDTYTVSVTPAGIQLTDGQRYHIQFTNANTGAATLNVNSQGAKSIKKRSGEDLDAGDITSGQHHLLAYDGTNFQCLSCGGSTDGFVTVEQMMDSIESATQDFAASVIYNGNSPSTVTVGGLPSGSSISGQTFESIIQAIVAPYVSPAFSFFRANGQTSVTVAKGTTLSGSYPFTWSITENSGDVNVIDIYDITEGENIATGIANDGSESVTINPITLGAGQTQQWRGVGYDANNSNAAFNSGTVTYTGRFPRWSGPAAADPADSEDVKALANTAFQVSAGTFDMETGTTHTAFYVAAPPGWVVSSANDLDALNAPITFTDIGDVTVDDAGSGSDSYTIFRATVGIPYSESHTYRITMALE